MAGGRCCARDACPACCHRTHPCRRHLRLPTLQGHLVGHIKDIGQDPNKPETRLYATSAAQVSTVLRRRRRVQLFTRWPGLQAWLLDLWTCRSTPNTPCPSLPLHLPQPIHNDGPADVVTLLSLSPAKEGGASHWSSRYGAGQGWAALPGCATHRAAKGLVAPAVLAPQSAILAPCPSGPPAPSIVFICRPPPSLGFPAPDPCSPRCLPVCSHTVYNEILRKRPDLLEVLAGSWFFDRKGEVPPGKQPFFEIPVLK